MDKNRQIIFDDWTRWILRQYEKLSVG
jgi:hypothetical protein